jgi:tripartite-type tricarboxylate transporter receptor subunit TctC
VKAFAVTAEHRLPQVPDVPTTAEAGLPDFKMNAWFALQMPKGTPSVIVAKVHQALEIALDDPNVQQRMAELGIDPAPQDKRSSDWLKRLIKAEISFWKPLLAGSGL